MRTDEVKKLEPKERFLYWIKERESVRIKKESGCFKPWTDDESLQTYKFCNIRRMDDRVSRWLGDKWYGPYYDHPNILTAVTLARQFNNTDTLQAIGFPEKWNPKKVRSICEKRSEKGLKNFSAAYMITGTLGGTKIVQIVEKVVDYIHNNPPEIDSASIENTWRNLLKYPGFASFMAGQVTADLRWAMRGTWKDKDNWAPMGPGSKRGLNRLLGIHYNAGVTHQMFNQHFPQVIDLVHVSLPSSITDKLEAIDIQNCLCEFDKYERTLWDGRRPKQKYPGA